MYMSFKDINIGYLIQKRILECGLTTRQVSRFLNMEESEVQEIYSAKVIDIKLLLRISELLEYDFFRIYTQHLILHAPPGPVKLDNRKKSIPKNICRKNIYTKQIIDFILELLEKKLKTESQIIKDYGIPKTTLFKWINKNRKLE